MPDNDARTTDMNVTATPSGGSGLYLLVGALVCAALVGAYVLFGAPGLHTNLARAPDRDITITVEQPPTPTAPRR